MANQKKDLTTSWDAKQVRQAQQNAAVSGKVNKNKKKKRLHRGLLVLIYLTGVILVSAMLASVGWLLASDLFSLNKMPVNVTIVVEESDTVSDVAQKLQDAGLIKYKWFFCLAGRFLHADEIIEPGEYEGLTSDMDYRCLIHKLHHYATYETVQVTIPEGKTVSEIFDLLEENNVCTRAKLIETASNHPFENRPYLEPVDPEKPENFVRVEGYLFPDTYDFYIGGDPVQVLETMMNNFERRVSDLRESVDATGYSLEQIIILASIIEKESNDFDEERANIASVLYNRLKNPGRETQGMLQMDSTIDYALALDGKDRSEFSTAYVSPYNTYTFAGFPAGAICNPGLASITAAIHPNATDYFYFAAGVDGHSHFFTNLDDHYRFVNSDMYKPS